MTKETEVWVCDSLQDTTLQRFVTMDLWEEDRDNALAIAKKAQWGEIVTPEEAPKEFLFSTTGNEKRAFPDFFHNSGFIGVSQVFADVLQKFDMGGGALHPIDIVKLDKTHVEGQFYCWTIGNKRQLFLPELVDPKTVSKYDATYESAAYVKETGYTGDRDTYGLRPGADGTLPVSGSALEGSAVWVDPFVPTTFFMQGSLVAALKAAGVATKLKLYKCRVVSGN